MEQIDFDMRVGQRLRALRLEQKMSLMQLGAQMGIAYQQVQKYEMGKSKLSARRLYQCAQLFGVPITYFFDEIPKTGTKG